MVNTDKTICRMIASMLAGYGVKDVVISPGSRNTPLVMAICRNPVLRTRQIVDERTAAFIALGMASGCNRPVTLVCTSGSAVLNFAPAVAEAYYRKTPLIVISADRPRAWIDQDDSQTIRQHGVLGGITQASCAVDDVTEDVGFQNRVLNDVLATALHGRRGPVHINVPISEPLFRFTTEELPKVRVITRYQGLNVYDREYTGLIERLNKYNRRMIVAGQMNLIYLFEKKYAKLLYKHFAWLTEHTGNKIVPGIPVKNFDAALYALPEEKLEKMVPDLLITYGGHIVSKRLKQFLRKHPPREHWHVSLDGKVADLYGSLTTVIEMDPFEFLEKIAYLLENRTTDFPRIWENNTRDLPQPEFGYSEMAAIGALIQSLPTPAALHLGNSSAVRYAQLYMLPEEVEVCCNRGTSGIEGSLSTAIGYSVCSDKLNFVVLGDLSFFYDMNALWNTNFGCNLRILLLNNGGGEIFQTLPELEMEEKTHRFVTATHKTSAKGWAEEREFFYLPVHNDKELTDAMAIFTQSAPHNRPMLMEVFTDAAEDVRQLKEYYHQLKK